MSMLQGFYEGLETGFSSGSVVVSFTLGLAFGIAFICSILLLSTILLRKDIFSMTKGILKVIQDDIDKEINKKDLN